MTDPFVKVRYNPTAAASYDIGPFWHPKPQNAGEIIFYYKPPPENT